MTKQNFIEKYTPIIKEFVESENTNCQLKIPRVAIEAVDTVLFSLKFDESDFDCNGWEYDFWRYYTNSKFNIRLSGDAWYQDEFILEKTSC